MRMKIREQSSPDWFEPFGSHRDRNGTRPFRGFIFKAGRLALAVMITAILAGWTAEARAQNAYNQANSYAFGGQKLTSDMVRNELERRLALNPDNEATIWNAGYDFFRGFPHNQDTARIIKEGFLRARANTPEHRLLLQKGAIYWAKVHDYGIQNVPVAFDPNLRGKTYYGPRRSKASTLAQRASGSQHRGFPNHEWPGRRLDQAPPYQGRADNPYPGKYYPGVYPP